MEIMEHLIIFAPCAIFVITLIIQLNIFARAGELSALETKLMKYASEHFVDYKIYHDNHSSLNERITQIDSNVQEVKNLLITFLSNTKRGE